jgi:epsilon-lactone hydrolase
MEVTVSWQARLFNGYARLAIRRRHWGDAAALSRRARRLFGASPLLQRLATRGVDLAVVERPGIRGEWLTPLRLAPANARDGVLMYVHGGGYVSCSAATHRPITAALAKLTGLRVFSVDYRTAPEARFPSALDDVVASYRWLQTEGAPGVSIAVAGESAGGGLVLALAQHTVAVGWRPPACVAALSPWTDLVGTGLSRTTNDGRCDMFRAQNISDFAAAYLGDAAPDNPRASPLLGPMDGLPPVLLEVGSTELLLDDARRMHARIRAAGGESRLSVYDGVAHAWQLGVPFVPEATAALREVASFSVAHLARP